MAALVIEKVEGLEEGREKARGSFGFVCEVRVHGTPCAAKRLHNILVGRGQEEAVGEEDKSAIIAKFQEECKLLSSLHHPNIVQFMGVHYGGSGNEADITLIMEYMHMDLEQCMKTYPNIPLPYKIRILRDVAYGLAYLHSIPIIHRDLNTGNVLLTESLRAKIADLGVSKLFDKGVVVQRTRTVCPGAQDFMPPESLTSSPKYDVKLDVFSFGHLIIYLANQKPPPVHELDYDSNKIDYRKKQVQVGKRRGALDQMGSQHPLYSIAVQCLGDTPEQRPSSADLVVRLEEILKDFWPPSYKNCLEILAENEQNGRAKQQEIKKLQNEVHVAQAQVKLNLFVTVSCVH